MELPNPLPALGHETVEQLLRDPPVNAKPIEPRKTLRDEFAMAALTGFMVNSTTIRPAFDAQIAYECADAMMAERSKKRDG